jgi:hypothetical protein
MNTERDYGWWNDFPGVSPSRLSWKEDTGTLYFFHAGQSTDEDSVEILASIPTRQEVDELLKGWELLILQPYGMYMIKARIAAAKA